MLGEYGNDGSGGVYSKGSVGGAGGVGYGGGQNAGMKVAYTQLPPPPAPGYAGGQNAGMKGGYTQPPPPTPGFGGHGTGVSIGYGGGAGGGGYGSAGAGYGSGGSAGAGYGSASAGYGSASAGYGSGAAGYGSGGAGYGSGGSSGGGEAGYGSAGGGGAGYGSAGYGSAGYGSGGSAGGGGAGYGSGGTAGAGYGSSSAGYGSGGSGYGSGGGTGLGGGGLGGGGMPNQQSPLDAEVQVVIREIHTEQQLMEQGGEWGQQFKNTKRLLAAEADKLANNIDPEWLEVDIHKSIKVSKKVLVPNFRHPRFNFVGKILGPKGSSLQALAKQYKSHILILGRGSTKDRSKEQELLATGDPQYAHYGGPLHVKIETIAPPHVAYQRVAGVLESLSTTLQPTRDDNFVPPNASLDQSANGAVVRQWNGPAVTAPVTATLSLEQPTTDEIRAACIAGVAGRVSKNKREPLPLALVQLQKRRNSVLRGCTHWPNDLFLKELLKKFNREINSIVRSRKHAIIMAECEKLMNDAMEIPDDKSEGSVEDDESSVTEGLVVDEKDIKEEPSEDTESVH